MTKAETTKLKKDAKWAFEHAKIGRVTLKDIILLEANCSNGKYDYIMFRNNFTGREYQVYDGWNIEEYIQ